MFEGGMTLQQFERLANIHDLSGEERAILMYRFGIGDGILRTLSEVADIMNRDHNYDSEDEYTVKDIMFTESVALQAIYGPNRGA